MRRSTALSVAIATALSAATAAGASPAQAEDPAAGVPQLANLWADPQHPGILHVRGQSDSPITRVTAHFFAVDAPDGTAESGSTSDFTPYPDGYPASGVWSAVVQLPQQGDYRVTVDIEDADGDIATGLSHGVVLHYRTALKIQDLKITPVAPDINHQRIAVTGTLVAEAPGDPNAPVTVAGGTVEVGTGHGTVEAVTGPNGRFAVSVLPARHSFQVGAVPGPSPAYPGALEFDTFGSGVTTVQAPLRFSVSTHALNPRTGGPVTVTGRTQVLTVRGWMPIGHVPLQYVSHVKGYDYIIATATSDSDGNYALRIPSTTPVPSGDVVAGSYDAPFLSQARQPLTLRLAYATDIDMAADLGTDDKLRVFGDVWFSDQRAHWPSKPTVTLEYSKNGRTGWKSAATIPVTIRHNKALYLEEFSHTLSGAPADGYWRARFNGNPDLASSTTKTFHLHRHPTRIVGFNASPEPVRKGDWVHLNGTVQYNSGTTWKALGRAQVSLYFRPRGAKSYRYLYDVAADSRGRIADFEQATVDGTWAVRILPDSQTPYLNSNQVSDYVDVR
ncbi:hypothetical protein [Peterkaempfera sp. SMS 1(5)a]|uniref:hypothetical protein n=1 Tax=Peterkaempfera podocarpi TaxID=3232308 RepID=UPI003672A8A2